MNPSMMRRISPFLKSDNSDLGKCRAGLRRSDDLRVVAVAVRPGIAAELRLSAILHTPSTSNLLYSESLTVLERSISRQDITTPVLVGNQDRQKESCNEARNSP